MSLAQFRYWWFPIKLTKAVGAPPVDNSFSVSYIYNTFKINKRKMLTLLELQIHVDRLQIETES